MQSTSKTDIGRFMLGIGAIIEHKDTGSILVTKRDKADFQEGVWELIYGRLDHHEEILTGLRREIFEELAITDIQIGHLIRVWHFYRGEKTENTEIYGMTFHCTVDSQEVTLNAEHSAFAWITQKEALQRIEVTGIQQDLQNFIEYKKNPKNTLAFSTVSLDQTFI